MSYDIKVYVKIIKGIYGLTQTGILENKQLRQSLKKDGYFPYRNSVGLWKHYHRTVWFTLVVDDFWSEINRKGPCRAFIEVIKKVLW